MIIKYNKLREMDSFSENNQFIYIFLYFNVFIIFLSLESFVISNISLEIFWDIYMQISLDRDGVKLFPSTKLKNSCLFSIHNC